eukprot:m.226216 g.226216  ORF g.226216 m.226216 type:complete len:158 (-) comp10838_c1_seq1:27-500(-)
MPPLRPRQRDLGQQCKACVQCVWAGVTTTPRRRQSSGQRCEPRKPKLTQTSIVPFLTSSPSRPARWCDTQSSQKSPLRSSPAARRGSVWLQAMDVASCGDKEAVSADSDVEDSDDASEAASVYDGTQGPLGVSLHMLLARELAARCTIAPADDMMTN